MILLFLLPNMLGQHCFKDASPRCGSEPRTLLLTAHGQQELQAYMGFLPHKPNQAWHGVSPSSVQAAHWSDPARAVLQTEGLLICRMSCCHQENLRPTKTSSSTSLYHSPDATTLGNTELLKETASKFAQTLLQKETLSLLSWMANKSALCLREKLSLSFQAICHTNILKKIFQNRSCQYICSEDVQKSKRFEGNCLLLLSP